MNAETMYIGNVQWRGEWPVELKSQEVHVWRMDLRSIHAQHMQLTKLLSPDEWAKAQSFHFEKDRERFIITRAMLRTILGHYLQQRPEALTFEYTSYGKPVLFNHEGGNSMSFNVSHSGDMALYAVASHSLVGIDVENVRRDQDIITIAQRFFTARENSSIIEGGENARYIFYQYWTRKEALLKAMGKGVSYPMEQCDVSEVNGDRLAPVVLPNDEANNTNWYVMDLFPGDDYAGAIAIEGENWDISYWNT